MTEETVELWKTLGRVERVVESLTHLLDRQLTMIHVLGLDVKELQGFHEGEIREARER